MCILRELFGAGVEKLKLEEQHFVVTNLLFTFTCVCVGVSVGVCVCVCP